MRNWSERARLAFKLGPMARFRLRAEILLESANEGAIPITPDERERLERICIAPTTDDEAFLGSFDRHLGG